MLGSCHRFDLEHVENIVCKAFWLLDVLEYQLLLDFTPQWATRSLGHEWNALITKDGKPLSFGMNGMEAPVNMLN